MGPRGGGYLGDGIVVLHAIALRVAVRAVRDALALLHPLEERQLTSTIHVAFGEQLDARGALEPLARTHVLQDVEELRLVAVALGGDEGAVAPWVAVAVAAAAAVAVAAAAEEVVVEQEPALHGPNYFSHLVPELVANETEDGDLIAVFLRQRVHHSEVPDGRASQRGHVADEHELWWCWGGVGGGGLAGLAGWRV